MKDDYSLIGVQIEGTVKKEYDNAIRQVKEDDLLISLRGIDEALKALSKSRYECGKELDWASEIIIAYRNLARLYKREILGKYADKVIDSFDSTDFVTLKKIMEDHKLKSISDLETTLKFPQEIRLL